MEVSDLGAVVRAYDRNHHEHESDEHVADIANAPLECIEWGVFIKSFSD